MKTLKNTQTDMPSSKDETFSYKDLILSCVNAMKPNQGIRSDEMRQRIRIVEAIEEANDVIEL